VKQSLLFWIALFSLYLLVAGGISWRKLLLFVLVSVGAAAVATGMGFALWGDDYWFWVFEALRKKQVSLLRDIRNLFDAGIYALMGLFGGWEFVLRDTRKNTATLWGVWLLLFANEVYTSGFAFQRNHLGPGILIGACWFFVALVKIWPTRESAQAWWQYKAQEAVVVVGVILVFGALGLAREPLDPVPDDFDRYVADIEREFEGLDPAKVLMDTGTWIYLRENVLMKDRSAPLSVHTGANQNEISHEMLTETIERIEAQTYDKILARQLDTGDTWYDFQDRGSGVKTAILETYHVVRRIPGVRGIGQWWPNHLVAEVLVLAPNND
jgi:hypothetical protein